MTESWIKPAILSFQLMAGRTNVIQWFDNSYGAMRLSFMLAIALLPLQMLRLYLYGGHGLTEVVGPFRFWSYEFISYIYLWVSWPILCSYLFPYLPNWKDKPQSAFFHYLAATNWLALPSYLVFLGIEIVAEIAGFEHALTLSLQLGVVFWTSILHWHILRNVCGFRGMLSTSLVMGDFFFAQFILLALTSFMIYLR